MPAPNAYKTKDLMGINFNSKFRSGKLISMSQKFRYKDSRESYPGPGAYLRFSEFGILVSKNEMKKLKIVLILKFLKLRLMKMLKRQMQMLKQLKMKQNS